MSHPSPFVKPNKHPVPFVQQSNVPPAFSHLPQLQDDHVLYPYHHLPQPQYHHPHYPAYEHYWTPPPPPPSNCPPPVPYSHVQSYEQSMSYEPSLPNRTIEDEAIQPHYQGFPHSSYPTQMPAQHYAAQMMHSGQVQYPPIPRIAFSQQVVVNHHYSAPIVPQGAHVPFNRAGSGDVLLKTAAASNSAKSRSQGSRSPHESEDLSSTASDNKHDPTPPQPKAKVATSSSSTTHRNSTSGRSYKKRIRSAKREELTLVSSERLDPDCPFEKRRWKNADNHTFYDCSCGARRPTHDGKRIAAHIKHTHFTQPEQQ